MGLIAAALNSASGVLADQWLEYFYADAISADVLVVKGQKKTSGRSSNTKASDNIISNGSAIAVADGQCMIIVEQGKVVDLCAVPGVYTYDSSTEPSIFDGGKLGSNIKALFSEFGKRFKFGGEVPNDQRVYYFNTKEITGNKYGTPSALPFRVVDARAGIDMDINVRCFGEYSYKITNPMAFYVNICGNVSGDYNRSEIDGQLKSEFLTHLQGGFARISEMGIRYSSVLGHTKELGDAMKEELTEEWRDVRGIELVRVGVSSLKADEEDEKTLKEMQKTAAYTNDALRQAYLANQAGEAMTTAAGNSSGAMAGFMGMGMASNMGVNLGTAFAGNAKQNEQAPAKQNADTWVCPSCKKSVSGNFCTECGAKKPDAQGWICPSCKSVNKGKFCGNCGAKKPAEAPLYKCDKCGWEPENPKNPPKFCPECGDSFGEEDISNK